MTAALLLAALAAPPDAPNTPWVAATAAGRAAVFADVPVVRQTQHVHATVAALPARPRAANEARPWSVSTDLPAGRAEEVEEEVEIIDAGEEREAVLDEREAVLDEVAEEGTAGNAGG